MNGINQIKYLSQIDPTWINVKIGTSQTTIGQMGCAITGLSMLSDYFGCYRSPAEIAQDVAMFQIESLVWTKLDFPTFDFRWREGNLFSDAVPLDMDMIRAYLDGQGSPKDPTIKADRACLLEVNGHRHWVVGLWTNYDGDILAIDTYNGKTCLINEKYHNITAACLFVRRYNNESGWRGKQKPIAPNYN